MNKLLTILFLLFLITNCARNDQGCSSWKIKSISTENPYLNHNLIIEFSDSEVLIKNKETGDTFKSIVNNDRLVIEIGQIKWLFEIKKTTDSAIILHELYSKLPIEITLMKI